jgi:hypothetical protein
MPGRWLPSLATLAALLLSLLIWTDDADARLGARLGDGRSLAGASATAAYAIDYVIAFDSQLLPAVAQPTYPGGSLGGLFSRPGLLGGFAAGFLGSGVIGLLFGHGVVGELSGVASVLGLMFQLALIAMLVRLIWTWWHDDKVDALADLSPRQLADAYGRPRNEGLLNVGPSAHADDTLDRTESETLTKTEQPHS